MILIKYKIYKNMKTIEFRAKGLITGTWLYGNLLTFDSGSYIVNSQSDLLNLTKYSIQVDTICQYVGKLDKNQIKIFEGDIVRTKVLVPNTYGSNLTEKEVVGIIYYNEANNGYYLNTNDNIDRKTSYHLGAISKGEVIGNIYADGSFEKSTSN